MTTLSLAVISTALATLTVVWVLTMDGGLLSFWGL